MCEKVRYLCELRYLQDHYLSLLRPDHKKKLDRDTPTEKVGQMDDRQTLTGTYRGVLQSIPPLPSLYPPSKIRLEGKDMYPFTSTTLVA